MIKIMKINIITAIVLFIMLSCKFNTNDNSKTKVNKSMSKDGSTCGFISVDFDEFLNSKDSLFFYKSDSLCGFISKATANLEGKNYDVMNTSTDTLMSVFKSIGFYPEYSILEFKFENKIGDKYQLTLRKDGLLLKSSHFLKIISNKSYLVGRSVSISKGNKLYADIKSKEIVADFDNFSYVVDKISGDWLHLVSDKDLHQCHVEGWTKLISKDGIGVSFNYSY